MWLSNVFTNYELESKTRELFQVYRENKNQIFDKFEECFGISYKLAFGNKDPNLGIYDLLEEYYPNEYYIKKAFSKKYLKDNNTIYEYPVFDSRADVVNINDSLCCYEIKTKYDNLDRLNKQINDYSKVFEYVYVVCSEDKLSEVRKIIPKYCGIISYKDRKNCAFCNKRKAKKSPNFEITNILLCLNQKELIKYYNTKNINEISNEHKPKDIIENYKVVLRDKHNN